MADRSVSEPIEIDGSTGEGGGQIIRTSVSLAAITGQSVRISRIRAGRSKPGLQAQHLASVRAAAACCNASLKGAEIGSQFLSFSPGDRTNASTFSFEVGTAGAVGLVAQTALVPMLYLPAPHLEAVILGGTHVPMAPPADYIEAVYVPALNAMGARTGAESTRAGFFPRGGGELTLHCESSPLTTPIDRAERGRLRKLRIHVITCQLPEHVATRGIDALTKELRGYGAPIVVEKREQPGGNPGAAIVLIAECDDGASGWTSLGERGKPMERVAQEALRDFQKWHASGAAVDAHLADQLALPCATIAAESRWSTPERTGHLDTVLEVISRFLPIRYSIEEQADGNHLVRLTGVAIGR